MGGVSRKSKRQAQRAKRADATINLSDPGATVPPSLSPVLDLVKGTGLDSINTRFRSTRRLGESEVDGLYTEGIGRRIIDLPIDGALSDWPSIKVEESWRDLADEVEQRAVELEVPTHYRFASKMASKDGWNAFTLGYADAAVDPSANAQVAPWGYAKLVWARGLRAWDCTVRRVYGPSSPRVGEAREIYNWRIRPDVETDPVYIGGLGDVHGTRFTRLTTLNGRSDFELVAGHLANLLGGGEGVGTLLSKAALGVYKIKNWEEKMRRDPATSYATIQAQNLALSTINALVLDMENEEFTQLAHGALGGSEAAVYALSWLLAAAAGIPMTLLYGMSPGGFSDGSVTDEQWQDRLRSIRRDAEPHLRMVYDAIWAEVLGVAEVPEYSFEWPPLRPATVEETAAQTKVAVEAGRAAVEAGLTTTSAVATGLEATGGLDLWEWRSAARPVDPEATPEQAAGLAEEENPVAETALNGAQISSVIEVAEKISLGILSPESGLGILRLALPTTPVALLKAALPSARGVASPAALPVAASPSGAPPPGEPDLSSEETDEPEGEDESEEPPLELPTDLVSAREAATTLGISPAALGGMAKRGEIRRYRVGSAYRYSQSECVECVLSASD